MRDFNNFSNLLEVLGRNFDDLKLKLASISQPAKIIKIEREPTGKYYAVVQLDRPAKKTKKPVTIPDEINVDKGTPA